MDIVNLRLSCIFYFLLRGSILRLFRKKKILEETLDCGLDFEVSNKLFPFRLSLVSFYIK